MIYSSENKADLYRDGSYLERHPTWHIEDSPWKARQVLKLLDKHRLKPRTVSEIGCGAGEILNQLHSLLPDYTEFHGYEISPQAYELACRREKPRLHFHLKDLTQENVRFDLLLMIDVFEHVEDYLGFLRCCRSKGSYVVFHIPLDLSVRTIMSEHVLLLRRNKSGHLHYFTQKTALATLRDTGYEVVDYIYTAGAVELSGGSLKRKLARLLRRLLSMTSEPLSSKLLGGFSLLVLTRPIKDPATQRDFERR